MAYVEILEIGFPTGAQAVGVVVHSGFEEGNSEEIGGI
jgi:hypothetical protein